MEGKDNRSLGKRHAMKQLKNKRTQRAGGGQNTTSSSTPPLRGVADVADSSDERFVQRDRRWGGGMPAQQTRCYDLDELDLELNGLDEAQQAQMRAGDFTMMSQLPTSVGGHFKFSAEKNWDAADVDGAEMLKSTEASEYFTLNLKLLNAGLRTIPFHKRMDYAASMFTNDELAAMEKAAEIAEKEYQHIQAGGTNPVINVIAETASAKSARTNASAADAKSEVANETEKNIQNGDAAAAPGTPNPTANNNDIQEWLDNVLEEGN